MNDLVPFYDYAPLSRKIGLLMTNSSRMKCCQFNVAENRLHKTKD